MPLHGLNVDPRYKDQPFNPRIPKQFTAGADVFTVIRDGDVLLHHPYDSFAVVMDFLNTAADALRLCREIGHPSVGVLFDTFHANVEEKDIAAALQSLGAALYHVHLSENDRGVPGTGHIPFREVLDTLKSMEYAGAAVVESFATTIPEIARAAAIWRDLYPSSDRFAIDSMAFLRQLRDSSPPA